MQSFSEFLVLYIHGGFQAPHAGYIIPSVVKQGQPTVGYFDAAIGTRVQPRAGYQPVVGTRDQPPYVGYLESSVGVQDPYVRYPETSGSGLGQTRGVYLEPAALTYAQPHAVYVQPAIAQHGHDLYAPRLIRFSTTNLLYKLGLPLLS